MGIVAFQTCFFIQDMDRPWTDDADFNGAVWSQAAHNFLEGGFAASAGIPAPFHFGPMPVPGRSFYCHHPGLLAMVLAGVFQIFGEAEWAARMVPILCSSVNAVLLWGLVRSCAGNAAATFAAALFVSMPMQLRWGQMVNFEPCALMWMLAGFLGLRYWEQTGHRGWRNLALFGFSMAMATAWLGYFMAGVLCAWFCSRAERGRFAGALAAIAAGLGGVFLVQISLARPDALGDLARAFWMRFGQRAGSHVFTLADWGAKVSRGLESNIPIPFALIALVGAICLWHRRRELEGLRWLGWMCGCFLVMNGLYVVGFRNASYIHEYAFYYFIVPVAVLAGIGVRAIGCRVGYFFGRKTAVGASAALVISLGALGYTKAGALHSQARILDLTRAEPDNLIPALGELIRSEFPPEAEVLANVDVYYTPQFWYYSKRTIVNGFTKAAYWKAYLSAHRRRCGGIIWLGAPEAAEIVALLQPGSWRTVQVEGIPFAIWNPQ